MKHALAFLLFTLALPLLSRADATGTPNAEEMPDPQKVEQIYQFLCVPGSGVENSIPADEKDAAIQQRAQFHELLRNPKPVLAPFEKVLTSKDSGAFDRFGASLGLGITCGITQIIAPKIEAGGCSTEKGEKLSASETVAECARIEAEIKKSQDE